MLRSTELNTFNKTNAIYRCLVCRVNGGIYRLRGGTSWRYDGKASCISKQTGSNSDHSQPASNGIKSDSEGFSILIRLSPEEAEYNDSSVLATVTNVDINTSKKR